MDALRFREFPVYKDAKKFRKFCKKLLGGVPQKERYVLIDQIERALLSIILNIAEGASRRSDTDFARFLEHSVGSTNEVLAGFDVVLDDGFITADEFLAVEEEAINIANQLGGFIRTLRKSKQKKLSVVSS